MSQKFTTGVRFTEHFGALESLSFWGEGVGGGLYIAATVAGQLAVAALGVGFVFVAVVALLAHLGNPQRSWRAPARVASAWVSRGTLTISGFFGLAVLALGVPYLGNLGSLQTILTGASLAFAVLVMIYAGALLSSMKAIHLWRGIYLPLAFTAHSLTTGFIVVCAVASFSAGPVGHSGLLLSISLVGVLLCGAITGFHLTRIERSAGVHASLKRLLKGDLRRSFVWGAIGLGMVVPLIGLVAEHFILTTAVQTLVLAVVAVCRLYGDFAYRSSIVQAGAYEPIIPASLSKRIVGNTQLAGGRPFFNHG